MADVFISYAREDRARAEQVARGLQQIGLEVFYDSEIPPGRTWADYIEEKLAQSKAMIVLWSANSVNSQWVREEARMGRDKGRLIPVMLDASPAPFGFGEVQAADLSHWRGAYSDPAWVRFSNAVDSTVRGPDAKPRPVPQAPPAWQSAAGAGAAADAPSASLSPPGYVLRCLRKYFDGNGRARRMEYWSFFLFQFIILIVATGIDIALFGTNFEGVANQQIATGAAMLALLAPGVTATIRRFHDVGLSGWLVLGAYVLVLAYGLGAIIIIVVALLPGQRKDNKYGPDPKAA
ncbi:MAG: TIR domain-containing protein [Hyphomonadaceae bacterium]